MKKILAAGFVLSLMASPVFGQGGAVGVRERAKEQVRQNNVRQGVPSPAQPQKTAPPTAQTPPLPAARPVISAQESITKISADLAAVKAGSPATAAQKQQLLKDVALSVRGTKPNLPTVTRFVDSLSAALADATLEATEQTRLATDIESVMNSGGMPPAKFDEVIADVQAILQVGHVKRNVAVVVANDLKTVGAEVRR